jgi:hypothetical protein
VSTTNSAGANDKWRGFDIDGASSLGAAGSNASLRLVRPNTELNVTITDSAGVDIDGRFTDCFIYELETVGGSYGIQIAGNRSASPTEASNTDLTIVHPVIDQCTLRGFSITDLNKWGSIKIIEPYVGAGSAAEGLRATNCEGHIGILGGQIRMANSTGPAIIFDSCRQPTVEGTHVAECRAQAFVLNVVDGGLIQGMVVNHTQTLSAAVQLIGTCVQNVINVGAHGTAAKVSIGYQSLASSNNNNELHKTRLVTSVVNAKTSFAAGAEAASVTYGV